MHLSPHAGKHGQPPKLRTAFLAWLSQWPWHRFVTLATNNPTCSTPRVIELLKEWDARMNRKIAGPMWLKRPDEALWTFCFLEKPRSNPHWHCLVRFMQFEPDLIKRQTEAVDHDAARIWERLCPGGSVDVKTVYDERGLEEYVSKSIGDMISYERFVVPDEFRTHP